MKLTFLLLYASMLLATFAIFRLTYAVGAEIGGRVGQKIRMRR